MSTARRYGKSKGGGAFGTTGSTREESQASPHFATDASAPFPFNDPISSATSPLSKDYMNYRPRPPSPRPTDVLQEEFRMRGRKLPTELRGYPYEMDYAKKAGDGGVQHMEDGGAPFLGGAGFEGPGNPLDIPAMKEFAEKVGPVAKEVGKEAFRGITPRIVSDPILGADVPREERIQQMSQRAKDLGNMSPWLHAGETAWDFASEGAGPIASLTVPPLARAAPVLRHLGPRAVATLTGAVAGLPGLINQYRGQQPEAPSFVGEARAQSAPKTAPAQDPPEVQKLPEALKEVGRLQIELRNKGYYTGNIDGQMKGHTEDAMRRYQADEARKAGEGAKQRQQEIELGKTRAGETAAQAKLAEEQRVAKEHTDLEAARLRGNEAMRQAKLHQSTPSWFMQKYGPALGYGAGVALGGIFGGGSRLFYNRKSNALTRRANDLLHEANANPDDWMGNAGRASEFSTLGQENNPLPGGQGWKAMVPGGDKRGPAIEPFPTSPHPPGYDFNPASPPGSQLFQPGRSPAELRATGIEGGGFALDTAWAAYMEHGAQNELAAAREDLLKHPDDKVAQDRYNDAEDKVALYESLGGVGRAGGLTTAVVSGALPLKRVRPMTGQYNALESRLLDYLNRTRGVGGPGGGPPQGRPLPGPQGQGGTQPQLPQTRPTPIGPSPLPPQKRLPPPLSHQPTEGTATPEPPPVVPPKPNPPVSEPKITGPVQPMPGQNEMAGRSSTGTPSGYSELGGKFKDHHKRNLLRDRISGLLRRREDIEGGYKHAGGDVHATDNKYPGGKVNDPASSRSLHAGLPGLDIARRYAGNARATPYPRGSAYAEGRPVNIAARGSFAPGGAAGIGLGDITHPSLHQMPWESPAHAVREIAGGEMPKGYQRHASGGDVEKGDDRRHDKPGKLFHGAIEGPTGGRADKVPMTVRSGAYVVPADCVAGRGQGNTEAGQRYLAGLEQHALKEYRAKGGSITALAQHAKTPGVPIKAAHGERVIPPEIVAAFGEGDLDRGHQVLDHMVKHMRERDIHTLQNLPPPQV